MLSDAVTPAVLHRRIRRYGLVFHATCKYNNKKRIGGKYE